MNLKINLNRAYNTLNEIYCNKLDCNKCNLYVKDYLQRKEPICLLNLTTKVLKGLVKKMEDG